MTVVNYFVSEMKVNSNNHQILVSFKRIPTAKEKKNYEAQQKSRKEINMHLSSNFAHFARIAFQDPYGEMDSNYDLAFPNMYMVIKVKEVQNRKLTIGSVVAFNVPENQKDILKPVNIDE